MAFTTPLLTLSAVRWIPVKHLTTSKRPCTVNTHSPLTTQLNEDAHNTMNICWDLRTFDELTPSELYTILQLRQKIFVVEQDCPYLDCDNKDQNSHHLLGWDTSLEPHKLIAYLRIQPPKDRGSACNIGRVLCHPSQRGSGFGKDLMRQGISQCIALFPQHSIHISAQQYLVGFYTNLGFSISSAPYEEDGIPHIGMTFKNEINAL